MLNLSIGARACCAAALLIAAAAVVTGCSSNLNQTVTLTPSATAPATAATSAPPTSSLTPAPAAGFDLPAIYAACDAAVPTDVWGSGRRLPPRPDTSGPAASDPYTADHTNGDPDAIYVNVQYFDGNQFSFSALCVASGDKAAPTVEFVRTLD